MKKPVLILIFLLSISQLFAQYQSDTIEVRKSLGVVFRQNGKNLTPRQLMAKTQSIPEAFKEMQIAKNNYDVGTVFGCAGGFMVGWPIGAALGGGKANWAMAGIGAGLICISIPFSSAYSTHAKNAVRLYNHGKLTGMVPVDFKLSLTANGIGVKMNF